MSGTVNAGVIEAILRLRDEFTPVLARMATGLKDQGAQMQQLGRGLLPISLAFAGIGIAGVAMATDLNRSMANVASLIPGATARVLELKEEVQSMAIATGKSTDDLAGGLYQVVSAFGDTADTAAILDINARAAAAGLAATTDAINLTSAVTKGYGDTSAAAVLQVSDLALLAVRLGQTTFPELAASIGRVTPLAAELKVSQEELFGVMATFTGVTGGAAEVSTQLRGVLQALMAPTDDMQALFTKLGVESGKAAIEQLGLQATLKAITDEAVRTGAPLQDFLSQIEGQTLALAAAGGQAAVFTEKTAAMRAAAGTSVVAFREQTEGVNAAGFAFEQMKVKVTVALQQLGDELIPILVQSAEAMEPVFNWVLETTRAFKDLPEPVKLTVAALAGIVAISAPTLMAIGAAVNLIGTAIGGTGVQASTATPQVAGFWTAVVGPLALAGGVIVALKLLAEEMREFGDVSKETDDLIKKNTVSMKDFRRLGPAGDDVLAAVTVQVKELTAGLLDQQTRGLKPTIDLNLLLSDAYTKSLTASKAGNDQSGRRVALTEAEKEAAEALRKELLALAAAYNGKQIAAEVQKLDAVLRSAGGAQQLWVEGTARMAAEAYALQQAGGTLTPELKKMVAALDITKGDANFFDFVKVRNEVLIGQTLPTATAAIDAFWTFVEARNDNIEWMTPTQVLPGVRTTIDLATGEIITAGATAGSGFADAFSETLSRLGPVIVGAIQGGGDVGGSIGASVGGSIGADLAKSILGESTSKLAKGALSFLGPLGALAGGALGNLIGGLFGDSKGKKELLAANAEIETYRQQLLETYGSLQDIARLDAALGTDVAAGWQHQGKVGLAAFGKSAEELASRLAAVRDEMSRVASEGGLASASLVQFRDAMPDDANVQAFSLAQVHEAAAGVRAFVEESRVLTQEGASAMASVVLAAWDGTAEGLRDLLPTIQGLQARLEEAGFAGGAAFTEVVTLAQLATGEISGPMVSAINAATGVLTAMYNAGFLTQETFGGMVTEIMAQRDALLATGATAAEVNAVMRSDLQRIWELTKDGTFAVDEKTAALLAEAEAAGQVGDKFRSTEDRMLLALERIAAMFETAFGDRLTSAAQRGAEAAAKALAGIPTDFDFDVRPHVQRGEYGDEGSGGLPGFAGGTGGRFFDFGAGTPVMLHGRERVMTEAEGRGDRSVHIDLRGATVRDDSDIDVIVDRVILTLNERGL